MHDRQRWIALVVGMAVASGLCTVLVDRPAATFAHDTFHSAAIFVALTHLVDPILPASASGFLLIGGAMLFGWAPPPAMRLAFCLCVASLLAIVMKDQLKYAFGRTWPETWVNGNPSWIRDGIVVFSPFHGGTGWTSFPSGHMTTITAPVAVLMGVVRRGWRWLLALPVALVAIGLYGADYHFVGDMVAGVLVGAVCAAIVARVLLAEAWMRPAGVSVAHEPPRGPTAATASAAR